MHIYNIIMGLPPTRGAGVLTRLETKSAHACKALLMGSVLLYLTSGFKTPTILLKITNMAYLGQKSYVADQNSVL